MDSFVCKIVILDQKDCSVPRQKKVDRFIKASPTKKCLFGVADPKETDRLLEEQFEIDRLRFNDKFGFDLLEIEELERADNIENINTSNDQTAVKKDRKFLKARRRTARIFKNQTIMTGRFAFIILNLLLLFFLVILVCTFKIFT